MEQRIIQSGKLAIADLLKLAQYSDNDQLFVDYDKEVDVLYLSFGKPQKADDATEEDGIIRRTKNKKLIGLTIINASRFKK